MSQAALIAELSDALAPGSVLCGEARPERVRSDASTTGREMPLAVLRPASVEEVSAALAICHRHGVPVVPQGGMTGLAGGANAGPDAVALSLERLVGIEEIDAEAASMTVWAGTPLQKAQEAAEAAGFLLPIDLGSRGSCQIGGNIATNAGGLRVIRHGTTRENVLGIEAVLADGAVLSHLGKVIKDNTGYDLRHLFAGSEGTLGVITRAVLRLRPLPQARRTALCALSGFDKVLRFLALARAKLAGLSAFEAMWRDYFVLNRDGLGLNLFPDAPPFSVIIEAETDASEEAASRFEAFLETAFEEGLLEDAIIAQSGKDASAFWAVREGHAMETLLPGVINLDISLAIGRLDEFASACTFALRKRYPHAHVSFYGHIGDGNVHIAVHVPEEGEAAIHEVDVIAYGLVRDFGGSISAEHGIGTLKRDFLDHSRSPAEIATMRRIKAALDPSGIMNPGKVLPPAGLP